MNDEIENRSNLLLSVEDIVTTAENRAFHGTSNAVRNILQYITVLSHRKPQ